VLVGGAIVRVGCFLAGCCHGTVTSLPFGVRYAAGTRVFDEQVARGLIAPDAASALPIHPTQLYEAALCLLLAAGVTRFAQRERRGGSQMLLTVAGLSAIRFTVEFVRDSGERFGGLSLAQWITIVAFAGAVATLRTASRGSQILRFAQDDRRPALAVAGMVIVAALLWSRLSPLESEVILAVIAAAVALAAGQRGRAPTIGLSVLMLQTPGAVRDYVYPHIYKSLGGGIMGGAYTRDHVNEGCDSQTTEQWRRQNSYVVGGIQGGIRRESNLTSGSGLRVGVFFGSLNAGAATARMAGTPARPDGYTALQGGVSIAGDADAKYAGITLGLVGGSMDPLFSDPEIDQRTLADPFAYASVPGHFNLLPVFGLRLGPRDGISFEIKANDNMPAATPSMSAQFGFAVGDSKGNRLRLGFSDAGPYVGGSIVSKTGLEIMPFAAGGSDGSSTRGGHAGVMVRKWYMGR